MTFIPMTHVENTYNVGSDETGSEVHARYSMF